MRHIGKVSQPAAAREIGDFAIFGLGAAFWSEVLPGGPFEELGDLVGKWNEKIAGAVNGAID